VAKAIADRDTDRAEREMVRHLFDVVGRIETNLGIDLQQRTLCGFNFIHRKPQPRRSKAK